MSKWLGVGMREVPNELGGRGRDGLRFLFFRGAQAVGFHFILQRRAADAEGFGGPSGEAVR